MKPVELHLTVFMLSNSVYISYAYYYHVQYCKDTLYNVIWALHLEQTWQDVPLTSSSPCLATYLSSWVGPAPLGLRLDFSCQFATAPGGAGPWGTGCEDSSLAVSDCRSSAEEEENKLISPKSSLGQRSHMHSESKNNKGNSSVNYYKVSTQTVMCVWR